MDCIAYLEIAVNNAAFVEVPDGLEHPLEDGASLFLGKGTSGQKPVEQITATDCEKKRRGGRYTILKKKNECEN